MHLLYLDESGSTADSNQKYFVLAGVSVYERQGYWLSQDLDQIAARFNPADPASVELHGSPMLSGRGSWRKVPVADRCQALHDALGVLATTHPTTRCFAVVVDKSAISPRDPVEFCFEQICSRFDQYLMRLHRANDTQRGIILFDEMVRKETTIQSLARDFRQIGHQWGIVRNLAEVPVFMDSRASRLLQLADLIAYATFRSYEKNDHQFLDVFKHRFDAAGGVVHGFYAYPNGIGGTCDLPESSHG